MSPPQRTTCAGFLHSLRPVAPFYDEIARRDAVRPWLQENELKIDLDERQLAPAVRHWLTGVLALQLAQDD